ncbi:MAG: AAA family ATPase [Chloroflexi bacterium]|nr:AAA family ATPase [Chloroflexota bacterium]
MKKRFFPLAALFFLALIAFNPPPLAAQSPPNAWHTYNRFDGLPGSWFFDITQTRDGAVWVASDEGVARFNGVWQTFTDDPRAPQGPVRALAIDASGQLWAAGASELWRYDGAWHPGFPGLPPTRMLALAAPGDGSLWLASEDGLFTLPPGQERWQEVADGPRSVSLLAVGANTDVWASDETQLFVWRNQQWQSLPWRWQGAAPQVQITAFIDDGQQGLWVGTASAGLLHVDPAGQVTDWYQQANSDLAGDVVTSLVGTKDGALWVGFNGGGVARRQGKAWQQWSNADGLAADFVTALFRDADGILWFGTVAGVSRYDPQSWQEWSSAANAPAALVSSFSRDARGGLWATTHGQGLFYYDGHRWEHFGAVAPAPPASLRQFLPADYFDLLPTDANQILPTAFLESSFIAADGALWLGTYDAGVLRYETGAWQQWTTADGLAGDTIVAIAQTPDGIMWFASYRHGLSRWDGDVWQTLERAGKLPLGLLHELMVDSRGRLWVGAGDGAAVFDGQGWQSYAAGDGLAAGEVMDIAEAPDGSFWFATWGGGVSHWQQGQWSTYTPQDGLLAPGVEAVWATDRLLWFGTVSGLSLYDGTTWQSFGVANGYQLGRIYALEADDNGGMYLGTTDGVLRFRPEHTPPAITVQAINGHAPTDSMMRVSPTEAVRLTLAGADMLTDVDELTYLYRLEGYDNAWRFGRTPFISYPPLPEGRYHFIARARDTSMNYSPAVELDLVVQPSLSTLSLPGVGAVRSEWALIGVALLTLWLVLLALSVWNILARMAMRRKAMERRFNPYVAGGPIRDTKMFFGRRALLNDIDAALYHNSLIVHGQRRIGKTSLLYQIRHRLTAKQDPGYHFIPIFIDLEGAPEAEFFHRLMEGVLEAVADIIPEAVQDAELAYAQVGSSQEYTDRHFRRDLRRLVPALQEACPGQPRLIFLLDEADVLNVYDPLTQQQFRRILQDSSTQDIGVVLAGVEINKSWDRQESPWYNMFIEVPIAALSRIEAEQLIREPVAGFYEWDDAAIRRIWQKSQGHPHRIQQICLEAVNIMLDHERHRLTLADVEKADERVLRAEHS